MYIPESFRISSLDQMHEVMEGFNFSTLVTPVPTGGPWVTHLPLIVDRGRGTLGTLRGHMAKPNPHWREFAAATSMTSVAIFHGPHAYISPRWYATKVAVPTWNYIVVHAQGRPQIVDDSGAVRAHLQELIARHESGPRPWGVDELDSELYEKLTSGIVCFSMEILQLEGKAKLGQNRSPADQDGMIAGLRASGRHGDMELAEAIRPHGSGGAPDAATGVRR